MPFAKETVLSPLDDLGTLVKKINSPKGFIWKALFLSSQLDSTGQCVCLHASAMLFGLPLLCSKI